VQHRLLALIPVALGLAHLALRADAASARTTAVGMALLSALGGSALFYHDYEEECISVFLQHAAIGFAGIVAAGAVPRGDIARILCYRCSEHSR
jgi:hypothetical protein